MIKTIKFGDIFCIEENEYIFLMANSDNDIYAAKILKKEESLRCEKVCQRKYGSQIPEKSSLICCYIKLTSENFKDRVAHLASARTFLDYVRASTTGLKINGEDKKLILKEILDPEVPVNKELKDLMKDINLN